MSETFDLGGSSGGTVRLPTDVVFEAAIMDFMLGRKKAAAEYIVEVSVDLGKVIKGYPNQCYSWLRKGIPNAIKTGDGEILGLCAAYGIDVNRSLVNQDREKIRGILDAKAATRAAAKAKRIADAATANRRTPETPPETPTEE